MINFSSKNIHPNSVAAGMSTEGIQRRNNQIKSEEFIAQILWIVYTNQYIGKIGKNTPSRCAFAKTWKHPQHIFVIMCRFKILGDYEKDYLGEFIFFFNIYLSRPDLGLKRPGHYLV